MSAFFSFLTDRGVLWIAKLLFVSILMAAWYSYGYPYQEEMVNLSRWFFAMTIFKYMTFAQLQLVSDFITLMMSWAVVSWILPHGKPSDAHTGSQT